MYHCKSCGVLLAESDDKSEREGEILYVCPECHEKWQVRNGNLYQTHPLRYPGDKKRPRMIRSYNWQDLRLLIQGKTHQEVYDEYFMERKNE